ncbi:MAG: hypothetical protein CV088_21615 [Nitrospira sp. LK70]|nr:hypothetical protein [Nitrospira sp. LK70]
MALVVDPPSDVGAILAAMGNQDLAHDPAITKDIGLREVPFPFSCSALKNPDVFPRSLDANLYLMRWGVNVVPTAEKTYF